MWIKTVNQITQIICYVLVTTENSKFYKKYKVMGFGGAETFTQKWTHEFRHC